MLTAIIAMSLNSDGSNKMIYKDNKARFNSLIIVVVLKKSKKQN